MTPLPPTCVPKGIHDTTSSRSRRIRRIIITLAIAGLASLGLAAQGHAAKDAAGPIGRGFGKNGIVPDLPINPT